jgi:hypothetical protein
MTNDKTVEGKSMPEGGNQTTELTGLIVSRRKKRKSNQTEFPVPSTRRNPSKAQQKNAFDSIEGVR